jgi:hypothetical protein
MWAFASLMDLIQSSLFFDRCSQFLTLHFLISPYTQSHHLHLGLPLGRLPRGWLAETCYTILLLSILLTWPIHLNLFILINDTISKSPYNCISSLLCRFLQQLLIFIAPSIFLTIFRSKTASRLPLIHSITTHKMTSSSPPWELHV